MEKQGIANDSLLQKEGEDEQLRLIINYIRSIFCKHEWSFLGRVSTYDEAESTRPCATRHVYRCCKCGYVQRVKF